MKPAEEHSDNEEKEILETKKHLGLNELPAQSKFTKEGMDYLESESTWEALGLEKDLIDKLIQRGFKKPSKIQVEMLRTVKNNNIVAQSQNGSGKTLGYLIPAIRAVDKGHLGEHKPPSPQVLIIADTVALIQQISKILRDILRDLYQIHVDEMYSGKKEIAANTAILVSTMAQLKNAQAKKSLAFEKVTMVIIDEADHVFEQDLSKNFFLMLINKHIPNPALKLIFTSATMTDIFRDVITSIQQKKNMCIIEKETEELTLKNVTQYMIKYSNHDQKLEFLNTIIQKVNAQNILIFDNKKTNLEQALKFLNEKGYKSELVCKTEPGSAEFNPAANIETKISDFLAGKYRIMLTTNLLSRGIDMRKVTLVINFSLPIKFVVEGEMRNKVVDLETYLHRVGRTGRFGDFGVALNFVNSKSEVEMLETVKNYYKNQINEINLDDIDQLNKELEKIDESNKEKRKYMEENL